MQNSNDRWLSDIKSTEKKFTSSDRAIGRSRPVDETGKRKKFKHVFDERKDLGKKKEKEENSLSVFRESQESALVEDALSKEREEKDAMKQLAPSPFELQKEGSSTEAEKSEAVRLHQGGYRQHLNEPDLALYRREAAPSKPAGPEMKEIIDQIIDKLYTLKMKGTTETTVVLKHPPLFTGAKLTLTAYDSATGEFNIKFTELSAQAKQLLDMEAARQALQTTLERKGYTMHIFIASTESEETGEIASWPSEREGRDDKREGGKEREQREQRG